jgi:hypothetical protein
MTKTVKCVGGPADGKEFVVSGGTNTLSIPYYVPQKLDMTDTWNLMVDVIGWDDYGPIYRRDDIKNAKYIINGSVAAFEVDTL